MIDEAASGSAFRMVTGETSKGATQTVRTPGGEVQSVGPLEESAAKSLESPHCSSSMERMPLPLPLEFLPSPLPLGFSPFEVG
eukprot:3895447-Alexandrium_andersonii.AAC.1